MRSISMYLVGGGAILIAVVGVIYFFLRDSETEVVLVEPVATSTEQASKGGYTIEQIPFTARDFIPDLNRSIIFSGNMPESFKLNVKGKIDAIRERLVNDETRANDWYDLAIWYHSANDFQGAKEVWEFLIKANPNDSTAYDNLGKLYHYALKDYPKSEEYFAKSKQINPESMVPYLELFQLYADTYKIDSTLAVDTLEETARKFPDATDPLTFLGQYYRDKKEYEKARDAYTRAMERARVANNIQLMNAIGEELTRLPR